MANIIYKLFSLLSGLILRLLVPLCVVFTTVLPGYIILRLYPTLLKFENGATTTYISLFFFMLFLGSSIAFLLHDFLIGPFFTIISALVIECISIILILWFIVHPSDTGIYRSLVFIGFPIGILQTCITTFFGDRHNNKLWYSLSNHFHFYLFGHFTAYGLSIYLFPLYYPNENFGICFSSICHRMPFYIAFGCIVLNFVLVPFLYWGSLTNGSSNKLSTIPATISRMKLVLIIFIPFVLFWMLTFEIEHLWIIQGQNMLTKMQRPELDSIRALIIILCVPIASLFRLNEVLRILLGGILIILSVFCSSLIGNFIIHPHRNMSTPNYTILYACNYAIYNKTVYISWGAAVRRFGISVPRQQCNGPFLVQTKLLKGRMIATPDGYPIKYYIENVSMPDSNTPKLLFNTENFGTSGYEVPAYIRNERVSRSISTLPFIRLISDSLSDDDENTGFYQMYATGGNPAITLNASFRTPAIREIPEGEYNVCFGSYTNVTLYFRSGGYYVIFFSLKPAYDCNQRHRVAVVERIQGYINYSIHYQAIQYCLFGLGKILIFSSGLDITYVLAEQNLKCSLVGIFWAIYYIANFLYYTIYKNSNINLLNTTSAIYQFMIAAIVAFYFLCYFLAYKLTDVILTLDGNDIVSSDDENVEQTHVKSDKEPDEKSQEKKVTKEKERSKH